MPEIREDLQRLVQLHSIFQLQTPITRVLSSTKQITRPGSKKVNITIINPKLTSQNKVLAN